MSFDLETEFSVLFNVLKKGNLIPFLGAGVNLCGRKKDADWKRDGLLPNGSELAEDLAESFRYPGTDPNRELQRISQYASVTRGDGELYEALHNVFSKSYPSTLIHQFLARAPELLRQRGSSKGLPLIITTNYDEVLEDEFRLNHTPFDVVTYVRSRLVNDRGGRPVPVIGRFWHLPDAHKYRPGVRLLPNSDPWRLVRSQTHRFPVDERTIILKIHGAVDRASADRSSFVITEDDYIDYLTLMDPDSPVPKELAARISECQFLFMGYALRDWNLRVMLQRITSGRNLRYTSWAIKQPHSNQDENTDSVTEYPGRHASDTIEEKLWERRAIRLLNVDLLQFVSELRGRLDALPLADAIAA